MRKLLSLLLALTLALGCALPAFADDPDARDTNFFTPRDHTELNYSDIEYRHVDTAPILAEIAALDELSKDAANADEFRTRFDAMDREVLELDAMFTILMNRTYANALDEWATEEYLAVQNEYMDVADAFNQLVRDVLSSPCADVLKSQMSEEIQQDYLEYEDLTEEERDLQNQNSALEQEYQALAAQGFTVTYEGEEWDDNSLYNAYQMGEMDEDTYDELSTQLAKNENAVLGELYLRMIPVRNALAQRAGYDNYAEYAYSEVYDRDYTVDEIKEFHAAVKQYIAPLASAMIDNYYGVDEEEMRDDVVYTGEGMFDTLLPYFAQLSDELYESANYIYTHGFYDVDPGDYKTGTAYSTTIRGYEAPFYFNNAYGNYYDLTTSIHELGHANEGYWKGEDWNDPSLTIDVAEVHSQALELLFLRFYPELFGDAADDVALLTALNIIYSGIVMGCLHDELQQYAYSTPDVTLDQINQKYRQLAGEYCIVDADDPRTEMFGWVEIPHTFVSPMYYISYATSAAGAFAFWEESQDDYFTAVDHYLAFTAQSNALGFQDSFAGVGMESPLSAHYIKALGETIHEGLMKVEPYSDVYMDDWYGAAVSFVTSMEMMNGSPDGAFVPAGTATREQAMTILARANDEREDAEAPYTIEEGIAWAVENGISDGTNPKNSLTREEFVTMLYRDFGGDELEGGYLDLFDDADTVDDWAAEAMEWAVECGIISGYGDDGLLHPTDTLQRSQMATMLMNYTYYIFFLMMASTNG